MSVSAGQPAPAELLIDPERLIGAYYDQRPDPEVPEQRVSFGTSGHRGSSLDATFTESHVLAIAEAVARYRKREGTEGPVFVGRDTHALSEPALRGRSAELAHRSAPSERSQAPQARSHQAPPGPASRRSCSAPRDRQQPPVAESVLAPQVLLLQSDHGYCADSTSRSGRTTSDGRRPRLSA